jgi:hypothetical protein
MHHSLAFGLTPWRNAILHSILRSNSPLFWGTLALCVAAAFTTLEVQYFYGGNWSGPFYIRAGLFPDGEPFDQFIVRRDSGFDGQYYLLAAYDPLLEKGYAERMDLPALRYNRILLPALAQAFSFGDAAQVPRTYAALQWLFVGLGAWALSDYSRRRGSPAGFGLALLTLPAVWISLDRMVVDLALVSLIVVAVNEASAKRRWSMALALAGACLARDTGIFAAGLLAACFWWRGERRLAAFAAAAVTPALSWWAYLSLHHALDWNMWLPQHQPMKPFAWTAADLRRLLFPASGNRHIAGRIFDGFAIAGLVAALALAAQNLRRVPVSPAAVLSAGFATLGVYLFALGNWMHPYDYGRVLSPLLAGLLLLGADRRDWRYALPALAILMRVAVQQAPKAAIIGFNFGEL